MMRSTTTTTSTVTEPVTNHPVPQPEPPHQSLSNAALLLRQAAQAASTSQNEDKDESEPLPTYKKTLCERAMRDMSHIIITHQNKPQWKHFASQPIARLMCEASMIGQQERRLNDDDDNVSSRTASQLHELVLNLKEMLRCPLSRQLMIRPVIDPLATMPFRLAFEERHLAHFYALQRDIENLRSTELQRVPSTSERPITFEPHPLVNDLCGWLRTHFPDTATLHSADTAEESHCVAVNTLPTQFSFYSFNIAITGEEISDIELEESQKQHQEQHLNRMAEMAVTNEQLAATRAETERMVQEQTEKVMREIQDLQRQCEARCNDLKTKNLKTEERLAEEGQLRAELDRQLTTLQQHYWAKMNDNKLATSQLSDIRDRFAHLTASHQHTQQDLVTTKAQFAQAQQQYNNALSTASNDRYRLYQQVQSLESQVYNLNRRNNELNDDVRRARNSDNGSFCVIA